MEGDSRSPRRGGPGTTTMPPLSASMSEGKQASNELCDDENTANSDGYSISCSKEPRWASTLTTCGRTMFVLVRGAGKGNGSSGKFSDPHSWHSPQVAFPLSFQRERLLGTVFVCVCSFLVSCNKHPTSRTHVPWSLPYGSSALIPHKTISSNVLINS